MLCSGDALSLRVSIRGPDGRMLYQEGPTEDVMKDGWPHTQDVSEGSFRFILPRPGTYTVILANPSASSPRTASLAWLVGRDDDDPFTAGKGKKTPKDGEEDASSQQQQAAAAIGSKANAAAYAEAMLARVSRLHKRLDEVYALQQYADVRFARHMRTTDSTHWRVWAWSLGETAVVLLVAVGQVLVVRNFQYRSGKRDYLV